MRWDLTIRAVMDGKGRSADYSWNSRQEPGVYTCQLVLTSAKSGHRTDGPPRSLKDLLFSIDVLTGNRSVESDQRVRRTRKNIKAADGLENGL